MGLFDRKGSTVDKNSVRGVGAPTVEAPTVGGLATMDEGKTTPPNVPSIDAVPDEKRHAPNARILEPEPKAEAEAQAQAANLFCTVLKSDVDRLAKLGRQPLHVEGPRTVRPHKLFVYDFSPEQAKELLA